MLYSPVSEAWGSRKFSGSSCFFHWQFFLQTWGHEMKTKTENVWSNFSGSNFEFNSREQGGAGSEVWNRAYMIAPVKKFGRVRLSTTFPSKQIWRRMRTLKDDEFLLGFTFYGVPISRKGFHQLFSWNFWTSGVVMYEQFMSDFAQRD